MTRSLLSLVGLLFCAQLTSCQNLNSLNDLKPAEFSVQPRPRSVAQDYADDRVSTVDFSHVINDLAPSDRVTAAGYRSPVVVMKGWMNSSGHRANILSTSYTELGVGIAKNSRGRTYWVQVFGRPR